MNIKYEVKDWYHNLSRKFVYWLGDQANLKPGDWAKNPYGQSVKIKSVRYLDNWPFRGDLVALVEYSGKARSSWNWKVEELRPVGFRLRIRVAKFILRLMDKPKQGRISEDEIPF